MKRILPLLFLLLVFAGISQAQFAYTLNYMTDAQRAAITPGPGDVAVVTDTSHFWICFVSGGGWVDMGTGGGSGANTALSNLASVSINTSLLAQTGVDAGSTAKPFRNLFLFGAGTYGTTYIELTGTPTGTRVWTVQDTTDTFVGLNTTDTLSNKTLVAPALGTPASGVMTNVTGTAASLVAGQATILQNARTIGGTSFNGSANITVASATGGFTVSGGTLAAAAVTSSSTIVQTSNSAAAFESGPNGSTNPVLRLVNNTGSQADGISITGLAAGSGTQITALSSGATSQLIFQTRSGSAATTALTLNSDKSATFADTVSVGNNGIRFTATNSSNINYSIVRATNILAFFGGSSGYQFANNALSAYNFRLDDAGILHTVSGGGFAFTASASDGTAVTDSGTFRVAPKVVSSSDGASNANGWFVDAGSSRVSTQFDKTNDTALANITGLTATVIAGRKYSFVAELYTSSNVGGGVQVAIAGTATATSIVYDGFTINAGLITQSRSTALGTAVGAVTAVTAAHITITGTIVVNAGGTLTVQFAQNATNGTASSVLINSTFVVKDLNN